MPDYTINQVEKRMGLSVATFKRWEKEGRLPPARRVMKASVPVRVFSEQEVSEYRSLILKIISGEQVDFDADRNQLWSPFPLPSGSPAL